MSASERFSRRTHEIKFKVELKRPTSQRGSRPRKVVLGCCYCAEGGLFLPSGSGNRKDVNPEIKVDWGKKQLAVWIRTPGFSGGRGLHAKLQRVHALLQNASFSASLNNEQRGLRVPPSRGIGPDKISGEECSARLKPPPERHRGSVLLKQLWDEA